MRSTTTATRLCRQLSEPMAQKVRGLLKIARFVAGFCASVCIGCAGSPPSKLPATPTAIPSIAAQPTSQTVTAGQSATFSVLANGTPAPNYQWQKNGADISGANASSYVTPATTMADTGSTFNVVVSNSVGSVTSNSAE